MGLGNLDIGGGDRCALYSPPISCSGRCHILGRRRGALAGVQLWRVDRNGQPFAAANYCQAVDERGFQRRGRRTALLSIPSHQADEDLAPFAQNSAGQPDLDLPDSDHLDPNFSVYLF